MDLKELGCDNGRWLELV